GRTAQYVSARSLVRSLPPVTPRTCPSRRDLCCSSSYGHLRDPHSFPTRRSSDLAFVTVSATFGDSPVRGLTSLFIGLTLGLVGIDRKSTRLNSSHVKISYAVFCLKKKKTRYLCTSFIHCTCYCAQPARSTSAIVL